MRKDFFKFFFHSTRSPWSLPCCAQRTGARQPVIACTFPGFRFHQSATREWREDIRVWQKLIAIVKDTNELIVVTVRRMKSLKWRRLGLFRRNVCWDHLTLWKAGTKTITFKTKQQICVAVKLFILLALLRKCASKTVFHGDTASLIFVWYFKLLIYQKTRLKTEIS